MEEIKLSDYIEALQTIYQEHGDLTMAYLGLDGDLYTPNTPKVVITDNVAYSGNRWNKDEDKAEEDSSSSAMPVGSKVVRI